MGDCRSCPEFARDEINGRIVSPHDDHPHWQSCDVNQHSIDIVRRGMFGVSNEPGGTAYRARIQEEHMWLSGKTGTAQVRHISMHERETGVKKNEDLPWKERDHALFVAYAPEESPRFAISVVVEHGGGGSAVAAPIARDIMIEVQRRELSRLNEMGKHE